MKPCSCFVTGTDTEIGKTLISSALIHAQAKAGVHVAAMKPIAAGAQWLDGAWHNEDVDMLAAEVSCPLPTSLTTPYLFEMPAAPHLAAEQEGVDIDVGLILRHFEAVQQQAQAVVVEGVGGFCVPLGARTDTADLAQQLALPVVLVVGMRLGCISMALLTAQAIATRGLHLAGWVANTVDPTMALFEGNVKALQDRLDAPLIGVVPRLETPSAAAAAAHLNWNALRTAQAPR